MPKTRGFEAFRQAAKKTNAYPFRSFDSAKTAVRVILPPDRRTKQNRFMLSRLLYFIAATSSNSFTISSEGAGVARLTITFTRHATINAGRSS